MMVRESEVRGSLRGRVAWFIVPPLSQFLSRLFPPVFGLLQFGHLGAGTVALMGRNHIGEVGVPAVNTAQPDRSMDFTFVDDGKDKWGLGFLVTTRHVAGKRSAGSLSWGGINNTYFWIDPVRGVAGVILMQFLPFADTKALVTYDTFERGVYELADASLKSSR